MTFLCNTLDLAEGQVLSIELGEKSYIISFKDGQPHAYLNRCPHLGVPLEWQAQDFVDKDTGLIRCATHGALFLLDSGECVHGPCQGDKLVSQPTELKENGDLFLR